METPTASVPEIVLEASSNLLAAIASGEISNYNALLVTTVDTLRYFVNLTKEATSISE